MRDESHRRMKEMQVQMGEESQMREEQTADNVYCKVKLPKLFITKFNGTHLNWFRFWNQFEKEGVKNVRFSKNLACFFLKNPF